MIKYILCIFSLLITCLSSSQERVTNIKSGISDAQHQLLHFKGQDYYIQFYKDGAFDVFSISNEGKVLFKHSNVVNDLPIFQEFPVLDNYMLFFTVNEIKYYNFITNEFFQVELPEGYSILNSSSLREHKDFVAIALWDWSNRRQDKMLILKKDRSLLELDGLDLRVEDISTDFIHTSYVDSDGFNGHQLVSLVNGKSYQVATIKEDGKYPLGIEDFSWWKIEPGNMLVQKDYDLNELFRYRLPSNIEVQDLHITPKYVILELQLTNVNKTPIYIFDKNSGKLISELEVDGNLVFSDLVPIIYNDVLILNNNFGQMTLFNIKDNTSIALSFFSFFRFRIEISEEGDMIIPSPPGILHINLNTLEQRVFHRNQDAQFFSFGSKNCDGRLLYYFGVREEVSNTLHQFKLDNNVTSSIEVTDMTDQGLDVFAQILIYDNPYVISQGNLYVLTNDGEIRINDHGMSVTRNSLKYINDKVYYIESDGVVDRLIRVNPNFENTVIAEVPLIFKLQDYFIIGRYLLFVDFRGDCYKQDVETGDIVYIDRINAFQGDFLGLIMSLYLFIIDLKFMK